MFPRSTHETFAEKLFQTFKDNKRFAKPKLSNSAFTIDHYAGEVWIFNSVYISDIVNIWSWKNPEIPKQLQYDAISCLQCSSFRWRIKLSFSWIRTRTMLLRSIRLSWMLQSVSLYQAYSHLLLKIHLKLQSSYLSVPNSRLILFIILAFNIKVAILIHLRM